MLNSSHHESNTTTSTNNRQVVDGDSIVGTPPPPIGSTLPPPMNPSYREDSFRTPSSSPGGPQLNEVFDENNSATAVVTSSSPFDAYYAPPLEEFVVVPPETQVPATSFDSYYVPPTSGVEKKNADATDQTRAAVSPSEKVIVSVSKVTKTSTEEEEEYEEEPPKFQNNEDHSNTGVKEEEEAVIVGGGEDSISADANVNDKEESKQYQQSGGKDDIPVDGSPPNQEQVVRRGRRSTAGGENPLRPYARLIVWTTQHIARVAMRKAMEQKPRVMKATSFAKKKSAKAASFAKATSKRSVSLAKEVSGIIRKDSAQAKKHAKELYEKHQVGPKTKYVIHAAGNQVKEVGRGLRNFESKHQVLAKSKERMSKRANALKAILKKPMGRRTAI